MSLEAVSSTTQANPARRRDSVLWLSPRGVAVLFFVWLATRWIFDSLRNLVPDEAYYWIWSRHLQISYLDHPPVIAYLIRLGTLLLGNTELGVRCLAGVMTAGTVLILTLTARRIVPSARAASFVPLVLLLSPMVAVIGSIMTVDVPACFFQAGALCAALMIFSPFPSSGLRRAQSSRTPGEGESGRAGKYYWIAFGISLGLALDSKYTSILLGIAVLLALISCPEGRRQFRTPWPWLAALIAAAIFSPVLIWNAQHHWASFVFQLHHGTTGGDSSSFKNLLDYVGGQFAICTPVLLIICIAALIIYSRRKDNPPQVRILLFSAAAPLLFFAVSALRRRPEANWPMFAYFPAILLFACYLAEEWGRRRVFWAEVAIKIALMGTLIIHFPELIWKISPKIGSPQWDQLFGWRDLAEKQVDPLRIGSPVFAADYGYASELSFYLPGQPEVRPLPDPTRLTAFDYFGDQSPPENFPRLVLVRNIHPKGYDPVPPWPAIGLGYSYSDITVYDKLINGRQVRRSLIEVASRTSRANQP